MNEFYCETCQITNNSDERHEEKNEVVSNHDYVLFTVGCQKCKVLESKLKAKSVDYEISNNTDIILDAGFTSAPILYDVKEKTFLSFTDAVKMVNNI